MKLDEATASQIRSTVYSSKEEILFELQRRQYNTCLKTKVRTLFEKHPISLIDAGHIVLSRVTFTPNFEFERFMKEAKIFGLPPRLLEYTEGKFVARDSEKYLLCKMYFLNYRNRGGRGGVSCIAKRIVDFNSNEGKPFNQIATEWGEPIVDFHHWLLDTQYPHMSRDIFDFSEWFNKARELNEHYYFFFLSLFMHQSVLCENYLLDDGDEADFAVTRLMPSFEAVTEYFGVKPLIYHLLPTESENSRDWLSYNGDILPLVEKRVKGRKGVA